jgi:penicillin-binding protein 1A
MSMSEEDTLVTATWSRRRRWLVGAAVGLLAAVVTGSLVGFVGLAWIARDLPTLRSLNDYQPPQATRVYGHEGSLVARYARERRTVVPYDRIPEVMVQAVIAAEDSDFFRHEGVDYAAILRCAVLNVMSGRKRCGGSTITQQTVKTFFLTPEKTLLRKLKEVILAKRLEGALRKEDILFLYLNQIYFGHGAYGVQEAAKVYFGIDVGELDVAQAALLAGLPKSPSRIDPYRAPERATERRRYVLGRMRDLGFITAEEYGQHEGAPIVLDRGEIDRQVDSSNHYAAHVRRQLEERLGEDAAADGGLKVHTGQDPEMQRWAEEAIDRGLRALDKRQGWRGPLIGLDRPQLESLRQALRSRRERVRIKGDDGAPVVWDLGRLARADRKADPASWAELAQFRLARADRVVAGIVTEVNDAARHATVDLGDLQIRLPHRKALRWARPFRPEGWSRPPERPSDVLDVGDVVDVRILALPEGDEPARGLLEQEPKAEAALVAMDPQSREVRAMVGGKGIGAGRFNRAIQARRQPGSTFKPFVYAAAFASGEYSPVSICLDAPRVYRDPWTGKSWKPENYGGRFDGEITLRTALTRSKNLCSVALIDEVGVEAVVDVARKAGIRSPLPKNLTLALGSGDLTVLEIVNAYATLATNGRYAPAVFVRKVVGPDEEVLLEADTEPVQTLRPEVAYQVVSLMQSVVEDGTARAVKELGRPVAGKTGTTNEARNAWFIGFTPQLVAGVWVGFDDNAPLGRSETGGRAAIPIWLDFMQRALEDVPPHEFVAPANIVFAHVDPDTGKLAPPDHEGARTEPFIAGTEPTELVEEGTPVDRGLWEDYE